MATEKAIERTPSAARIEAGRLNRQKRKGITKAGRRRLKIAAILNQPWAHSTGPKTKAGKARSAANGRKRKRKLTGRLVFLDRAIAGLVERSRLVRGGASKRPPAAIPRLRDYFEDDPVPEGDFSGLSKEEKTAAFMEWMAEDSPSAEKLQACIDKERAEAMKPEPEEVYRPLDLSRHRIVTNFHMGESMDELHEKLHTHLRRVYRAFAARKVDLARLRAKQKEQVSESVAK